jgi:hypothetical protein
VLSPYTHVTVRVVQGNAPNQTVVTSTSGVLLDNVADVGYEILVDSAKTLHIYYTATDWQGKTQVFYARIFVLDDVAPVIKIDEFVNKVSLGTVKMPDITVTDNDTQSPIVYVTIFAPNGDIVNVKFNDDKFENYTATVKGRHVMRITAFDDSGCMTVVEKAFDVQ